MSETSIKPPSDRDFIKEQLTRFFDPKLAERQLMMILDAVQYVEQLGAYGRSGHLPDMTIYALYQAFKDARESVEATTQAYESANGAFNEMHEAYKKAQAKLDRISKLVEKFANWECEETIQELKAILKPESDTTSE